MRRAPSGSQGETGFSHWLSAPSCHAHETTRIDAPPDCWLNRPPESRSWPRLGLSLKLLRNGLLAWLVWSLWGTEVAGAPPLPVEIELETPITPFFTVNTLEPLSEIRSVVFSSDGAQLCIGGGDKVAYRLPSSPLVADRKPPLRWEIEVGTLGQIHALAREADSDIVVVAGEGARGTRGDLAWFDLHSGQLLAWEHADDGHGEGTITDPARRPAVARDDRVEADGMAAAGTASQLVLFDCPAQQQRRFAVRGHQRTVVSVAGWGEDDWIVSSDIQGRVLARSRKRSAVVLLQESDANPYAPLRPIATGGPLVAVVPRYVLPPGQTDPQRARWELQLFTLPKASSDKLPAASSSLRPESLSPSSKAPLIPQAPSGGTVPTSPLASSKARTLPTAPNPSSGESERAAGSPTGSSDSVPITVPAWQPKRILQGPRDAALVTALAASADGRWVAAADLKNRLLVWDLTQPRGEPRIIQTPLEVALTMTFHPQRAELWIGLQRRIATDRVIGQLKVMALPSGKILAETALNKPVSSCRLSPDGQKYALTQLQDRQIYLGETAEPRLLPRPLPTMQTLQRATVVAQGDDYLLYYQTSASSVPIPAGADAGVRRGGGAAVPGSSSTSGVLNLSTLERRRIDAFPSSPAAVSGVWRITGRKPGQLDLQGPQQKLARVRYNPDVHGQVVTDCAFRQGGRAYLAIGMEHTQQILVYELGQPSRLCRRFWGHTGIVTKLQTTHEASPRFLVSQAVDGTVRLWSLDQLDEVDPVWSRWGAALTVQPSMAGPGRLRVERLDDNGPLFQKGLRVGDLVREIRWLDPSTGEVVVHADPTAVKNALATLPADREVSFFSLRNETERPAFNQQDAWSPLLGFLAVDDQWVAWNPAGYYACSAGGSQLIGWQVNQKLGVPPLFFAANRFQERFHRPDVIRRLLRAGQITDALALDQMAIQPSIPEVASILPPRIELQAPHSTDLQPGSPLRIAGLYSSRTDEPVTAIQLHINGRPAGLPRAVSPTREPASFDFQVSLPAGVNRIAVTAQTASSRGLSNEVQLAIQSSAQASPTRPKIHLLVIGLSKYRQPDYELQIPAQDVEQLEQVFRQQYCDQKYSEVIIHKLVNEQATLKAVDQSLVNMIDTMRIGDVGVIFFSGHGFVEDHFYLAPYDFDPTRLAETCLSDQRLGEICTRSQNHLLLMLNACYAGAANLLSAKTDEVGARFGREDYAIMLLAATPSNETAIQGAFSSALIEALRGEADKYMEYGIVETNEVSAYVPVKVKLDTQERQVPISSNLRNFFHFPLTNAKASGQ